MRKRNVTTKINEDDQQFQEFKRRYIEVSNSGATDWDISEPWEAFEDDKKLTDTKTEHRPVWRRPDMPHRDIKMSPKIDKEFPKLDPVLVNSLGKPFLSYKSSLFEGMFKVTDKKNRFFLVYVDKSDLDMAYNMQLVNFDKFRIYNYFFVTAEPETMQELKSRGMEIHLFSHFKGELGKIQIILLALRYGFNPIVCDTKIIFMQDPLPHLDYPNLDIALMQEGNTFSEAFGIIYASEATVDFFTRTAIKFTLSEQGKQKVKYDIFNRIDPKSLIAVTYLDNTKFQSGSSYYTEGKREFVDDNICYECVVVHNSDIETEAAKIYRLKEGLQWEAEDAEYFEKPDAKYMIYDNEYNSQDSVAIEDQALKTAFAIASLLDRILILPKMNCREFKCNILHRYKIEALENFLKGKYRESVFLDHDLVPDSIKNGRSPEINIVPLGSKADNAYEVQTFLSRTLEQGYVEAAEIRRWIQGHWKHFTVLHFLSLNFEVRGVDRYVMSNIQKGLCKSDYTQSAICPH